MPAEAYPSRIFGDRFVVYDDFLSETDWLEMRKLVAAARLNNTESAIAADRDGHAFKSRSLALMHDASLQGRPSLYLKVLEAVKGEVGLFGEPGSDWTSVSISLWGYPAGSGLSWHNDAGHGRVGAFVFFAHEEWDASWGGELFLVDRDANDVHPAGVEASRDVGRVLVEKATDPVVLLPRPNRLVLFSKDTFHCVRRVDPSAGETVRQTFTGFVSKEETASPREMLAGLLPVRVGE